MFGAGFFPSAESSAERPFGMLRRRRRRRFENVGALSIFSDRNANPANTAFFFQAEEISADRRSPRRARSTSPMGSSGGTPGKIFLQNG
jgi:hypothetical protein